MMPDGVATITSIDEQKQKHNNSHEKFGTVDDDVNDTTPVHYTVFQKNFTPRTFVIKVWNENQFK